MKEELFQQHKIQLQYQNYSVKQYKQNFSKEFIPNLSIIDILSNNGGNESLKIIKNSTKSEVIGEM